MRLTIVLFLMVVSSSFGQSPALQQYLSLTGAQVTAIAKLNSDYDRYWSAQQATANTLNNQLARLYAAANPDPSQLGAQYVALEAIRRDIQTHLNTLQAAIAAQLTTAQAALVQNLNRVSELQQLISGTSCAFLLDGSNGNAAFTITRAGGVNFTSLLIPYTTSSGGFCGSTAIPVSVLLYFSLTDTEVSAISGAGAAYSDYYARKQNRIADLDVEIRDETAKPSPDPMALGLRYAELASISQDLQTQANQLHDAARSVLTPAQTALLKVLQNDVTLQQLVYEAQNLNLLALSGTVHPLVDNFTRGTPGPSDFPITLRQYLSLTDQQLSAINKLNSDYLAYVSSKNQRVNTVQRELTTLYANQSPDPNQLGVRYVELEAIRRDIATHLATLQTQVTAQLNTAQVTGVQNLNTAAELQPLIGDAQCGFLIDPAPASYYFSSLGSFLLGYGPAPTGTLRSVDFSSVLSIFPYIPPAPTASFCGSTTFPISVRQYLNLTDSQVSSIFTASAAYNDYYARKQNRIADVNVEIGDETAKAAPDPLALGVRYSELEGIGQEIQDSGTQLRKTARAVLSSAQAAQLKTLQNGVALQPVIAQAEGCNLLVPAPGSSGTGTTIYVPTLTGYPTNMIPVSLIGIPSGFQANCSF